ncbi:unnamed protein product [Calicophoron daubneyi]|uniref:RNA helicase n=1 Tax=Calicophoron daubneyi TaxID=300641 RepID=A0AAV2U153_CALDB
MCDNPPGINCDKLSTQNSELTDPARHPGLSHTVDDVNQRTSDVLATTEPSQSRESKAPSYIRFSDLHIPPLILRGLSDEGFMRPSPVQIKAIPLGRLGLDLIVQAKSGTGKTLVFVVVILEVIDVQRSVLQALVLAPTREIAFQSQLVFQRIGAHIPGLNCQLFVGGLPLADDLRHLKNCHIAIGTPGRVRYLMETGYMSVEHVRYLVLDEADLLLAGGAEASITGGNANNAFPADVNYVWWSLPQNKQLLAFSATYTDYLVEEHLQRYMNNPSLVRLTSHDPALLGVRQFFHVVQPPCRSPASVFSAKVQCLCKLLSSVDFQQCLIFSNFHSSAQDLCDALRSRGWPVTYISSILDQQERFRAFNQLRAFQCRVLVSTDLTSRGIDAENVNLVVSLEVPWEHEIYVHRVGRAGRFGSYGASVLIVADVGNEMTLLKRLQSKCPTQIHQLPDPTPADLAAPDCPIDLDSLVTVVNLQNKHHNERSCRPQGTGPSYKSPKRERPGDNHHTSDSDQAGSVVRLKSSRVEFPEEPDVQDDLEEQEFSKSDDKKWATLPSQILQYLTSVKSENLGPTTFNEDEQMVNRLEKSVISTLDEYYANGMPPTNRKKVFEREKPIKKQEEPIKRFPPPLKEPPKHGTLLDYYPMNAGQEDAHEAAPSWTPVQLAAWYEYHKLLGYARYYHSAWVMAMTEYNAAVDELNRFRLAAGSSSVPDSEWDNKNTMDLS